MAGYSALAELGTGDVSGLAQYIGPGFWALLAGNAVGALGALLLGAFEAAAEFGLGAAAALACLLAWEWLR